jgi:hypothetical protein
MATKLKQQRSRPAIAFNLLAGLIFLAGIILLVAGNTSAFLLAVAFAILFGAIGYYFQWVRPSTLYTEPVVVRPPEHGESQAPSRTFPPPEAEAPPSRSDHARERPGDQP